MSGDVMQQESWGKMEFLIKERGKIVFSNDFFFNSSYSLYEEVLRSLHILEIRF